ncbi:hypothetical protein BASA50_006680 [Batrachochytrium salamandrivorans]|uniref:Uncharacterized protein n=1 Tax=Batrachochytrium salamandrivorans TaxID=1357716 RepID=A0ABQ8F9D4_9FUNG|nr:hypothetical protein BASA60_011132 [Batrachochytrium salamandrivorans]KAH6594433.1 hypothetical protein BASA50_006680 [Batrachochytrium salamandrivorans]KAH9274897.1 hypothetical protein BASA83_002609 [Batrachochytrium salamandrivorans]
MKLTSFAAISLLAITVSAYPGLGSDAQDIQGSQSTIPQDEQQYQSTVSQGEQQSQSTVAQDEQGSDHDRDLLKFKELEAEYEKERKLLSILSGELLTVKKEIKAIKKLMARTKTKLQDADLSDEQRLALEKQLGDYEAELRELYIQLHGKVKYHSDTEKECVYIREKMDVLEEVL